MTHNRFRLRNPLLKSDDMARKLAEKFTAVEGVTKVETNPLVGSLLVIYNTAETDAKTILARIKETAARDCTDWLTTNQHHRHNSQFMRRYTKLGLAASLAGTIGTLAVSGKSHAAAGALFLCFIAAHSYRHRRTLLR